MKKMLFNIVFFATGIAMNAQLQNTSFEAWENPIGTPGGNKPVGWTRTNGVPLSEAYNFYHDAVTDSQDGSYALRLSLWYTYDEDMAFQEASIATRPEAFTGHYTYTDTQVYSHFSGEIVEDEAWVSVYLTRWNAALSQNDTIGTGQVLLAPAENYTTFECPITYTSGLVPDKIRVVLDASLMDKATGAGYTSPAPGGVSSILTVDNVALRAAALDNGDFALNSIHVFPNPATERLNVSGFDGTASLYDTTGKQVLAQEYSSGGIDIDRLPEGIYLLRLDNGKSATTRKIIKQ